MRSFNSITVVCLFLLRATLAWADFQLSLNGVGPIVMDTTVEIKGKNAVLTGWARNDSGSSIRYAEWCVQPVGQRKCAFKVWTVAIWQPGETLKWNLTGRWPRGFRPIRLA